MGFNPLFHFNYLLFIGWDDKGKILSFATKGLIHNDLIIRDNPQLSIFEMSVEQTQEIVFGDAFIVH